MTSRDLVPKGLPQGERQKIEAARRTAGLANQTTPQPSPDVVPSSSQARPLRAPRASAFDALRNRTPTAQAPTGIPGFPSPAQVVPPIDSFKQRALASPNPVMRAIAEILPEYQ